MELKPLVPLSTLTTLRVGGRAHQVAFIHRVGDLKQALEHARAHMLPWFVLGGGSNTLFLDEGYPGIVLKIELRGIRENLLRTKVLLEVAAGESFDEVVRYAVARGWYGLENLSFIPGTVGAAPIQNIGAYGAEVGDRIAWVDVYDINSGGLRRLTQAECAFSYRDSVFKHPAGADFIVVRVCFELATEGSFNTSYQDVAAFFAGNVPRSLGDVREAIGKIRSGKFPDMRHCGTAGSFFKNPILARALGEKLQATYPHLPLYRVNDREVKCSLAWILDHVLGLKGVRVGHVGTFATQPLVLVTFDGATTTELNYFASNIADAVKRETNIEIEREVITPHV